MTRSEAIIQMLLGRKIGRGGDTYVYFNGKTFMYAKTSGREEIATGVMSYDSGYRDSGNAPKFKPWNGVSDNLTTEQKHVLSKYDIDKEDMDILEGR